MAEAAHTRSAPDRFMLAIVVGALALIVVGVVAVIASSRGAIVAANPASPVGVVQGYLAASRRGDLVAANAHLSQSARAEVEKPRPGFRPVYDSRARAYQEFRATIEPMSESPGNAEVRLTMSTFSPRDPFSTSPSHRQFIVRLVTENGAWRIDNPGDLPILQD